MSGLGPSWTSVEFPIPKNWTRQPGGWVRAARAIAASAREADLVHAHGIRAAIHTASASRLIRCPTVTTIHGFHAIHRSTRWRRPAVWATRWALARSALIFVLSADDAELVRVEDLAMSHLVREIPPLFEPLRLPAREWARRSFGIDQAERVALWIGRLEQEKDPMTFVRAVCEGPRHVVGLIVGDGSLRSELADACAACSCRFIFTGWLVDPAPAYAAADVYVNTSLWEVGPLTTLEAAATGLPLILSDVPGAARRLVKHQPEWTFPARDHLRLRELLTRWSETGFEGDRVTGLAPQLLSPEGAIDEIQKGYSDALQRGLPHFSRSTRRP